MTSVDPSSPKSADLNDKYAFKMAKKKTVKDADAAARNVEKGLFIINTGKGKGKSSAAFGMAIRSIAHGKSVAIVQFIKGAWKTGEQKFFEDCRSKLDADITFKALGDGFTWNTANKEQDILSANQAWEYAASLLTQGGPDLVILDELNIALRYDYIDLQKVISAINSRPANQHVVVTGRNAKPELAEIADTVSTVEATKHHAKLGVKAQEGIEY